MQARVGHLGTDPQPEAAAHRRSVVSGMKGNIWMRPLGHVLAILVGDADIVETDAVGAPGLVEPLVKLDEVDSPIAHVAGDMAGGSGLPGALPPPAAPPTPRPAPACHAAP